MKTLSQRLHSDRNRLGLSAVFLAAVVLILLAASLLLVPTKSAAASCGGITPVTTEAELNTAIAAFNAAPASCVFTIYLVNDITLTADLTPITSAQATNALLMTGDAATLDGDGHTLITATATAATVQVLGLTLTGSSVAAIVSNTNLLVNSSRLVSNYMGLQVTGGDAAVEGTTITLNDTNGIYSDDVSLNVRDSTISYNSSFGIVNRADLVMINSTVSGNGTGIYTVGGESRIYDSTIVHSAVNGLIVEDESDLLLYNSLLANSPSFDCLSFGPASIDIQYSLFETAESCGAIDGTNGNIVGADPLIGPLQDNGGLNKTHTHALLVLSGIVTGISPAIDTGNSGLLPVPSPAFDQRGGPFSRLVNSDLDMGAYEGGYSIECPAFPILVSTSAGLSDAIACYNALTSPGVATITIGADIDLDSSTLPIDNPNADTELAILGQGYTIDAQGSPGARPFEVKPESNVIIVGPLTISGGHVAGFGGGILNEGSLTLTDVTLSNNKSNLVGGGVSNRGELIVETSTFDSNEAAEFGGGIYADNENTSVTVTDSTFKDNASRSGGGIFSGPDSVLAVSGSTFVGNSAEYAGGGIGMEFSDDPTIVTNSTFSHNSAGSQGGGVANSFSALTINNSTFVGNSATNGGALTTGFLFCFTGDTQVLMADGTTKRIADIEVGDELLSYDFETGQQVTSTVRATLSKEVDEFLRLNDLEVTAEHPFAVGPDEWVKAKDLQIGDRVMSDDGWTTITTKERVEKTAEVYNINVDGPHNYYVSDGTSQYLVHNKLADVERANTEVNNSIITDSTGGDCKESGGTFQGINNLIDDHASGPCNTLSTAAVTNINATLADNGGPTLTHALLAFSNAINGGNNLLALGTDGNPLTTDQRGSGFPRIVNTTVDVGAYEFDGELPASYCPVESDDVGYLLTEAIGTGQGGPTKGFRTRKLIVPNSADVVTLYGQLAAVETGVMKYVRFLPQGSPKVQIAAPTSAAYRTYAIDWWGSDLPEDAKSVKGQFFWGAKANKSPRAFVLWPTYETDEPYANVFQAFDDSSTNHVAWEAGFVPVQVQTIDIPATQAAGADIEVTVALVDVNKDNRPILVTVEAGGVSVSRTVTVPNKKDSLNLEVFALDDVAAGTDEITITIESPLPSGLFPSGGDSAAMIGAAANYACGGLPPVTEPPVAKNDYYTFDRYNGSDGFLFPSNGSGPDELGQPAATLTSFGGGTLGGTVTSNAAGSTVAFANGSLTVNADGTWSLTGGVLDIGVFTFQYRLTNSAGVSDATVTLDIYELCLLGDVDSPDC